MQVIARQIMAIIAACSFGTGIAHAVDVPSCPPNLRVAQHAVDSPADWTVVDDQSAHPFVNVRFSEGEPAKQVFLAPSRGKGATQVWDFDASASGYWLSCSYAETSVMVTRKLPDTVKSCAVEYDKAFADPVVKRLRCR